MLRSYTAKIYDERETNIHGFIPCDMIRCLYNACSVYIWLIFTKSLLWRYNGRDNVSNHQPHDCLLNRLFRRRSKKTSKLRVTGLCTANSPGPVNSPHKWPVTRKMFPFDDVIMVHFAVSRNLGAVSIRKTVLPGVAIPMLKIRRPNGRLIFNIGIAIPR